MVNLDKLLLKIMLEVIMIYINNINMETKTSRMFKLKKMNKNHL